MKAKIITLITLILMGGMNLYAQNRRTLIAYFSWSGNTQHVAEYIAGQTGGTLFRIDPDEKKIIRSGIKAITVIDVFFLIDYFSHSRIFSGILVSG